MKTICELKIVRFLVFQNRSILNRTPVLCIFSFTLTPARSAATLSRSVARRDPAATVAFLIVQSLIFSALFKGWFYFGVSDMQAEPASLSAVDDEEHSSDEYGFEIPVMSPQVRV